MGKGGLGRGFGWNKKKGSGVFGEGNMFQCSKRQQRQHHTANGVCIFPPKTALMGFRMVWSGTRNSYESSILALAWHFLHRHYHHITVHYTTLHTLNKSLNTWLYFQLKAWGSGDTYFFFACSRASCRSRRYFVTDLTCGRQHHFSLVSASSSVRLILIRGGSGSLIVLVRLCFIITKNGRKPRETIALFIGLHNRIWRGRIHFLSATLPNGVYC